MNPRIINIKDIGTVQVRKNRRARNIRISIEPRKGIKMSVPYGVSFDDAEKFLFEKINWIKKHKKWSDDIEKEYEELSSQCKQIDRSYGESIIIRRVMELSKLFDFSYNRICVRKQKTRWGSCSYKNNINLNINILHLPEDLFDYVILHELMHTRIKNHSAGFWQALEDVLPQAKVFDKQLKRYQALLV